MATTLTANLHDAIGMLSRELHTIIEDEILARLKEELQKQAEPMLTKMARDMAENIKANVISYETVERGIVVVLNIDGVKVDA